MSQNSLPKAPIAAKKPSSFSHHGITKTDDYAWLKDDNWQEVMRKPEVLDSEIRAYLEAENDYATAVMKDTEDFQKILFEEMKGRIKEDDSSVPSKDGDFDYYSSYVIGGQHPRLCRYKRKDCGGDGVEEILLDGDALAKGHAYFDLGGVDHAPNHTLLAYGFDDKGSEYYTVHFKDLLSGENLPDILENTSGGISWSRDSKSVFYVTQDDNHRPLKVWLHVMGTAQSEDVLVYHEKDEGMFVGLDETQSGKYIMVSIHDHDTSEMLLIDADSPAAAPQMVQPRQVGLQYDIEHDGGDTLVILTNEGGAEDFKIMETPVSKPGKDNWHEIEPHRPGRLILDIVRLKHHLVRIERENGLPRIVIRDCKTNQEHDIAFDEEAYSLGLSAGYEFDTQWVNFSYASMTTPDQQYDYNLSNRERKLLKTREVPSGHEPSDYVTRRLMAPSWDGEQVPITLLYHKDTKLDGTAPLLLYGYGSYGISMPAGFSTGCLSLVNRGFVYAIAHIRGGKDKGYRWYTDGKLDNKTNTFRDFIAAGEFLVSEGFTSKGQIVAHGGSAGGMLMGAVANMSPELFAGIIAEVPFVDVLSTMLDDTLPLTPPEWPEWGNPIKDKAAYQTIAAYSPVDNVTAQAYPNILAVSGLTDPRVTYWEPAKWVATLRANNTGQDNIIISKTHMDSGHGGASGRFDRLKEVALSYAFALKVSGKAGT